MADLRPLPRSSRSTWSTGGWNVTVYCQRDVPAGSLLDGKMDDDQWCGIRRVFITVAGGGPRSTMIFDWRCVLHARTQPGLPLILGYNTACFLLLLRWHGRTVVTNMDGIEWKRRKWSVPAKIWFFMNEVIGCMTSQVLIADHPEIHAHLKRRGVARKLVMIPYGADRIVHASPEHLKQYGLVPNGFVVSIARIEPENSTLEIVRAFSRQRRRYLLVCLGKLDPLRNSYHREVMMAAGKQVLFPGAIYDKMTIRSIRRHALAYIHGHTVGGTNPSLVEALGAGNAIVAHRNKFNLWTLVPSSSILRRRMNATPRLNGLSTIPMQRAVRGRPRRSVINSSLHGRKFFGPMKLCAQVW